MLDAIKKAKLSTNATTAIIIVAALVYLGFAFNKDPASAAVQIIPVLGAVAGAIKIIHQGDVTEARATEAANTAVAAAEQSTQNNVGRLVDYHAIRRVATRIIGIVKRTIK